MKKSLNQLRDECFQNSKDHGFHDPPGKSVGDDLMLMVSELAEALEDFRKNHAPNEYWYEMPDGTITQTADRDPTRNPGTMLNKPCGIPSEIADVIIRAFDFCGKYNIDIDKAVTEKMAYNRNRTFKHGKIL